MSSIGLIIGMDPGKTCGFATLFLDDMSFSSNDLSYEIACDNLWALLAEWRENACVSGERYTISGRRAVTRDNNALELIGVARNLARWNQSRFMLNGVSDAQGIGNPAVLRQLGWWKPGGDHLNKAAAQVAYAFAQLLPRKFEQLTRV